jgi:hypothetical protein
MVFAAVIVQRPHGCRLLDGEIYQLAFMQSDRVQGVLRGSGDE